MALNQWMMQTSNLYSNCLLENLLPVKKWLYLMKEVVQFKRASSNADKYVAQGMNHEHAFK